ncbi:hypothetical protein KIN20_002597 [Parelaphostrongylus tenuis]|uniref:Uncharacterized protein n=1 Tax=Parelaphostrongylus tenuis TaxID=148309 RepID=A0AAD5M023_PARTN|nr:hypothetical protein KIN20_002597 [Parelaphostrongylus tenuis]
MEARGIVLNVAEDIRVEVKITPLPSNFDVIRAVLLRTGFDPTESPRSTSQEWMAIDNWNKLCAALKREKNAKE